MANAPVRLFKRSSRPHLIANAIPFSLLPFIAVHCYGVTGFHGGRWVDIVVTMTRRFILLALVLSFTGLAPAAEREFFFIQLSDPQIGMYAGNRSFEQETANFEFAVATVNRLKPAFVVVTGDLVNRTGDATQIAEYMRIVRKVDSAIPVYNAPGNHDVGQDFTPETIAAYRAQFGKDYYSFRSGPVYGIVLNSSLLFAPSKAQAEYDAQDRWLRHELEAAKRSGAPHVIVFEHHPFFTNDIAEKDVYDNIPTVRRKAYLDLLAEHGVRAVFTGHFHQNAGGKYGDLEVVVTGPVGMPLRGGRSGLRLVKIDGKGITHKYYDFGDLPVKP
jgi:3',5'-cyclic AMP phosphodiesterase CpdA